MGEVEELRSRYMFVLDKYVALLPEVVAILEKFGKYRKELQLLTSELAKYGEIVEDPKHLEEAVQEEIEKSNVQDEDSQ